MSKKDKPVKTHKVSKVTIKYKPVDDLGWEIDGSGTDGYDEVKGYNVLMYSGNDHVATMFISDDLHELKDHLQQLEKTIEYYRTQERNHTIHKRNYEFLKFIETEKTYYEQLLDDMEKV